MPALALIVIGSPSKEQKYQYHFVDAAACRYKDENTIWLVEKTGYEIYGVSLTYIKMLAPRGGYGWITPQATFVGLLNSMPDSSIKNLIVFSHGLRGLVALRYGWESAHAENYGLKLSEVGDIDPKKIAPNPTIEFDSCNSGVPEARGGKGIAQALADRLTTPVGGWTGRTSYASINHGGCAVQPSAQSPNPLSKETWSELWSRYKAGGDPKYQVFQPSVGR
jgi:hypothetical protein